MGLLDLQSLTYASSPDATPPSPWQAVRRTVTATVNGIVTDVETHEGRFFPSSDDAVDVDSSSSMVPIGIVQTQWWLRYLHNNIFTTDPNDYIEHQWPLFFQGQLLKNKASSKQNKGHLGSRCTSHSQSVVTDILYTVGLDTSFQGQLPGKKSVTKNLWNKIPCDPANFTTDVAMKRSNWKLNFKHHFHPKTPWVSSPCWHPKTWVGPFFCQGREDRQSERAQTGWKFRACWWLITAAITTTEGCK